MLDVLTHPFYLLSKPYIPLAFGHFVIYHFDILTKAGAKVLLFVGMYKFL